MRIGLTEDVFVLITFVVVAVVVGMLTGLQRQPAAAEPARRPARRAAARRVARPAQPADHDPRDLDRLRRATSTTTETRHELLGRVVDESERLDRIVGNLLSVSRVQAGALAPAIVTRSRSTNSSSVRRSARPRGDQ